MEYTQFDFKIKQTIKKLNIDLSDDDIKSLYIYMKLLLEWNEKMNLTAIKDPDEIILKHFIDSYTIKKYLKNNSAVLDIGTGAGFPGIPLSISNNNSKFTLADSLNKRIIFLEEIKNKLNLNNVELVHGRAEELGKLKEYREMFDFVVSRAVARLNVLLEYMLPFTKVGGITICMKAANTEEEIEEAKKAIEILGGKIEKVEEILLPDTDIKRTIILIKKEKNTPTKYPRKPGTPTKEPIV